MHAIDVCDRNLRERLLRHAFQATDVDAIHRANRCVIAYAKHPDATMLAEEVMVLHGAKAILGEFRFALEQAKSFRLCHRRPEAIAPADGAIAAVAGLAQVQVRFNEYASAVAAGAISFQHFDPLV